MANTKQIIVHGVIPDNFHAAFERTDDAHAATVRSWLARMNAPHFGLSITYEPPCVCGHSSNRHTLRQPDADPHFVDMLAHLVCEACDCSHFAAAGRYAAGGSAFYIGGTEAVSWGALESLAAALKAVGATIERASALDLDSGEDTWKSFKDAA